MRCPGNWRNVGVMRTSLVALLLLVPSAALAQPTDPMPPPVAPETTAAPETTGVPEATALPDPGAPPPPDTAWSGSELSATAPPDPRRGLTVELQLGFGSLSLTDQFSGGDSWGGASFGLGLGWFLDPTLAVSFRMTSVSSTDEFDIQRNGGLIGAAFQKYVGPRWWLGAGAGVAAVTVESNTGGDPTGRQGLDLGVRGGYDVWRRGQHGLSVQAELHRGFIGEDGIDQLRMTTFGVMLGYQYY